MTLEQWISLSPEERNRKRRRWPRAGASYWHALLDDACERFKWEFGNHSLINHIDTSAWHAPLYEPSIVVTTALWSPQRIEELPDRYCTFGVYQMQNEDRKDYYLRTWTLVLGELLGWSKAEVRVWARANHEDGLDGKELLFYHEEPLDYVAWLLVPEWLPHQLTGPPRIDLRRKLIDAIDKHGSSPLWDSPYDWRAAKVRIKRIVDEYEIPATE